ncbi:MAG TPA: GNAT family N-acetyltransferase [Bacteroidales bacterium]|nr:GNAT family N-acetyltransferase [Bacteroidales bacterium]
MPGFYIRKISKADIEPLQQIARKTFFETFSEFNTPANMQKYLDESFATEKLISELQDKNSEFWFAFQDEKVVGYLKINYGPAQTEINDDRAVEIERIYVLKELHGKNVGQLLYEKAFEIACKKKLDYMWLGVWEKNFRAQKFYLKNGFFEFAKHIFRLGNEVQTDLLLRKSL